MRTRGYTLIELVIVVAIVGILAAAVLPLARWSVKRQKEYELQESLRILRDAIDRYHDAAQAGLIEFDPDTDGYPPNLEVLVEGVEVVGDLEGAAPGVSSPYSATGPGLTGGFGGAAGGAARAGAGPGAGATGGRSLFDEGGRTGGLGRQGGDDTLGLGGTLGTGVGSGGGLSGSRGRLGQMGRSGQGRGGLGGQDRQRPMERVLGESPGGRSGQRGGSGRQGTLGQRLGSGRLGQLGGGGLGQAAGDTRGERGAGNEGGEGGTQVIVFLRRIPVDPFTGEADWGLRCYGKPPTRSVWCGRNVFDVHSKSPAEGIDGVPYEEW